MLESRKVKKVCFPKKCSFMCYSKVSNENCTYTAQKEEDYAHFIKKCIYGSYSCMAINKGNQH
uniref:Uncharacterized protein n=1 Tax=Candidatus Kentrum sp. DK TaxID=2126562 RepID=A0A450SUW0_9GAMM|nr:MAG: hypothetical protein BECKDK2373B_GA0170837_106824 [Candidatus Kentron sp. DK]